MPIDDNALQDLLAKEAIRELHALYCRGIDRGDEALIRGVFHADAVIHHPPWHEGGVGTYVAMVMASGKGALEGRWTHLVANELVRVEGARAVSEWYLLQINRVKERERTVDHLLVARFLERLERREGRWGVSERTIVRDITRIDPVEAEWGKDWPDLPKGMRGQRSTGDLSYSYFRDGFAIR